VQQCILPHFTNTENHIEPIVQSIQHFRDVGGIILAVTIKCHDDLTDGSINAGFHRYGLSVVAAQFQNSAARICGSTCPELSIGAVG